MRTTFLLSLFVFLLLFSSCGNGNTQDQVASNSGLSSGVSAAPMDIYIFIDKSESVTFQEPSIIDKATKSFTQAINMAKSGGDRVSLFYLHGNTGGASAYHSFVLPPFKYPPGANTLQKKQYKDSYNKSVIQQKAKAFTEFKQGIQVGNSQITKGATDIIGALEIVSKNTEAARQKYLLIFTDGIQTLNSLFVDPKDIPSAQNAAAANLKKIPARYSIQKQNLSGTKADMVLPFDALSTKHNKYLDLYWQQVFHAYQVSLTCK
ncbi:hypothetical protein HRG84_17765 [Flavisolibacter sp. BT320]|nr:hypothetical protein [Flavisolibacter longurius]